MPGRAPRALSGPSPAAAWVDWASTLSMLLIGGALILGVAMGRRARQDEATRLAPKDREAG